jgi:transcriptional regulator with XRE-family HTH domain
MFEPLPTLIRSKRLESNLSQDALAKLAGVSRRQLALFEEGQNVSLKFLIKVARALRLTELPIAELSIRAVQPDLVAVVKAADVLARLRQRAHEWANAASEIDALSASLDEIINVPATARVSGSHVHESAARLEQAPASERHAASAALRPVGHAEPAAAAPRPRSTVRRQRR